MLAAMPIRTALYLRPSADGISIAQQEGTLTKVARDQHWSVVATYEDAGSLGPKGGMSRSALSRALADAAVGKFDMLASLSADRLAESLVRFAEVTRSLQAAGVGLYLHEQGIDTRSKRDAGFYEAMQAGSKVDQAIRAGRIKEGWHRANRYGTQSGRPMGRPKVGPAVEQHILALRSEGLGIRATAQRAGVGVSVVQRVIREAGEA